jgi:hypothetical protein
MYNLGQLKLHELVTREYTLDEINEGYRDMLEGRNIRGHDPVLIAIRTQPRPTIGTCGRRRCGCSHPASP